jgi:hypothetical protein
MLTGRRQGDAVLGLAQGRLHDIGASADLRLHVTFFLAGRCVPRSSASDCIHTCFQFRGTAASAGIFGQVVQSP